MKRFVLGSLIGLASLLLSASQGFGQNASSVENAQPNPSTIAPALSSTVSTKTTPAIPVLNAEGIDASARCGGQATPLPLLSTLSLRKKFVVPTAATDPYICGVLARCCMQNGGTGQCCISYDRLCGGGA